MNELKVWKGTCDESTVYLDLKASVGNKLVTLVARDAKGGWRADLLYITKKGIRRTPSLEEKLGFETTHGGRIRLREDPATTGNKDRCPHCGHGGCD